MAFYLQVGKSQIQKGRWEPASVRSFFIIMETFGTGWMTFGSIRVMTRNPGKNKARKKMLQAWWERTIRYYARNDGSGYCEICVTKSISFIMWRLRWHLGCSVVLKVLLRWGVCDRDHDPGKNAWWVYLAPTGRESWHKVLFTTQQGLQSVSLYRYLYRITITFPSQIRGSLISHFAHIAEFNSPA